MKSIVSTLPFAIVLAAPAGMTAQEPKQDATQELAAPLRKFDRNRDGKLADDEMKSARQAHNRGGRDPEPSERRWRDMLQRRERDFMREREKDFDANGDGKVDDAERNEMRAVWKRMTGPLTELRVQLTAKYDRNDDGELNDRERNASRSESDRLQREIADRLIGEWKAKQTGTAKP
jgi:Ca2+-binding EF-hand superfamily protein